MSRLFTFIAAMLMLAAVFPTHATNYDMTIEENSNTYGFRARVDYHDNNAECYPNVWITYPDQNMRISADNDTTYVVKHIDIKLNVTGPNGFSYSGSMGMNPKSDGPTTETHGYCNMGIIRKGGVFNYTADVIITFNDTSTETLTETFKGSFQLPTFVVDESIPTIDYEFIPTYTGSELRYSIDLKDYSDEDVESALIVLNTAGESFNTDAKWHSTTLSGTITADFNGDTQGIWFKAQLKMKDGQTINLDPWDKAMTMTKKKFNFPSYSITINKFTRTGPTSGYLDYIIECDDLTGITGWQVWASRSGDENMDVTQDKDPTHLDGILELDVLPEGVATQIWPKVRAIGPAGILGPTVQTNLTVNTKFIEPKFTVGIVSDKIKMGNVAEIGVNFNITAGDDVIDKFQIEVYDAADLSSPIATYEVANTRATVFTDTITVRNLPVSLNEYGASVANLVLKAYALDLPEAEEDHTAHKFIASNLLFTEQDGDGNDTQVEKGIDVVLNLFDNETELHLNITKTIALEQNRGALYYNFEIIPGKEELQDITIEIYLADLSDLDEFGNLRLARGIAGDPRLRVVQDGEEAKPGDLVGETSYSLGFLSDEENIDDSITHSADMLLRNLPQGNSNLALVAKVNSSYATDASDENASGTRAATVTYPAGASSYVLINTKDIITEVEEIASNESMNQDPVYFTLQGIRVMEPEPGKIYIKLVNGTASRILAR